MKATWIWIVGGVLFPFAAAQGAVIGVTNGDFEAQVLADQGQSQSITSWFESSTATTGGSTYNDWLWKSSTSLTNLTNVVGLSKATNPGYLYQEIGTYTANEIVQISGMAVKRSGSGGLWGGLTVSLLSGNFVGADGTPLSATLLDSESFTAAGLGLPNDTTAATASFSAQLDSGTSGVNGQPLWLLIQSTNVVGTETFLDNVQAEAIPEPSAVMLLIAGSVGFMRIRRR